ncbi:C-X-C motif chemokine 2-like isoform X1 [Larus michahellis]|uniref:C-X-C motif chemokine 2-like isoform X1 n=1 Tax=Larus michahellis TaxID=119627 RepID=UPI003D9AD544
MRLLPAALALAMLLSDLVPVGGLSLESLLTNMRCKCIKSTARVINLGLILAIDVTPPGIHCRRKEIVLTLKKNKKVCVAPEAPWIQLLIHKLMQRQIQTNASSEGSRGFASSTHHTAAGGGERKIEKESYHLAYFAIKAEKSPRSTKIAQHLSIFVLLFRHTPRNRAPEAHHPPT